MQLDINIFSITLIISGILAGLFSVFIFFRLDETAKWFSLTMLSISSWAVFYGFELASYDLKDMLFWVKLEYLGIAVAPSTWLIFCFKYTARDSVLKKKAVLLLLAGIPFITYLLVLTNEWHNLYHDSSSVFLGGPFPLLSFERGPWYFVHTSYFYFAVLLGAFYLNSSFRHSDPVYRKRNWLLVISVLFPWVVNIIYLLGIRPFGHIDLTPYAFIFSYVILAFVLLKFKLFDVIPIAKDRLIAAMTDGVLVIDSHEKVIDLNPTMKKLLKINGGKYIGVPVNQFFKTQTSLLEAIRGRVNKHLEIVVELDQNIGEFSVEIIPLFENEKKYNGLLLLFKDITEAKNNQNLLRIQADELKQHNQLKDKLFSIISHDLKGPVLGVKEIIDLMGKGVMTDEDFQEILPELSKSVDGVTMLLENLLAWSRSQLKGEFMDKVVFDVNKLIRQQKNLMQSIAASKKVSLELVMPEPIMVFADKNMVELVIRNLLNNAIKFCDMGDSILVTITDEKDQVRISVKDTGMGISKSNLSRLRSGDSFSTFGSNNESGTGLGLMLVRDYVEKNGGRLWIDSEEHQWSEFSFMLPKVNMDSGGSRVPTT
jgi:signal transduction histidine kinase